MLKIQIVCKKMWISFLKKFIQSHAEIYPQNFHSKQKSLISSNLSLKSYPDFHRHDDEYELKKHISFKFFIILDSRRYLFCRERRGIARLYINLFDYKQEFRIRCATKLRNCHLKSKYGLQDKVLLI